MISSYSVVKDNMQNAWKKQVKSQPQQSWGCNPKQRPVARSLPSGALPSGPCSSKHGLLWGRGDIKDMNPQGHQPDPFLGFCSRTK